MDLKEFRKNAHDLVDWMADYLENTEQYPVTPAVKPGDIYNQLPAHAPEKSEHFADIFKDFQQIIVPGMTHWQHPSFFAYFTANSSAPSVLAEMLTATLGAQCMVWQTSPAAAELEEKVMQWLGEMCGVPSSFEGVIQDTASTATLCALLTAREKKSDFRINSEGFYNTPRFAVYCSTETHSSIDKGVKITGLGKDAIRKISIDEKFAMVPSELEKAIEQDIEKGIVPLCVVASIGTTSSTAIDPLRAIGEICQRHGVWLHVDGAFAGTATVLPEKRWMIDGLELADSYVFNPHKWMFTNFDCTAYYVKDKEALIRTFEILPEYLKTKTDPHVNNYRDWGIQLGRRFRALKLWFVIRTYGVEGIREKIRTHLELANYFAQEIQTSGEFELLAPIPLNLVCFRYKPEGIDDNEKLNALNAQLMESINNTGKAFLSHTKLNGIYTIRVVTGQTRVEKRHVDEVLALIREKVETLGVKQSIKY